MSKLAAGVAGAFIALAVDDGDTCGGSKPRPRRIQTLRTRYGKVLPSHAVNWTLPCETTEVWQWTWFSSECICHAIDLKGESPRCEGKSRR